ncbi:hypothetical protein [Alkalihalobacillus deserti]|uniref:hypothetical protein n=1 Tax=Alkalihalobacillus deserti TaxID=2879466 RepID=UPI001D15D16B|nr:hypothetical protein [Alkalihalobacillus deserti]
MFWIWIMFIFIFLLGLVMVWYGLFRYNKKQHYKERKNDNGSGMIEADLFTRVILSFPWWVNKAFQILLGLLLIFWAIYVLFYAPR